MGQRILSLSFSPVLTNAGGFVDVDGGFEGICADSDCRLIGATDDQFVSTGGRLVAEASVPEPTTLLLLGLGLAGFGFAKRKTENISINSGNQS